MENAFDNTIIGLYLYSRYNIITDISKEFLDFSGYSLDEIIGKSLIEIGDMLKINSQIFLNAIIDNYSGYIFTKLDSAIEVNISVSEITKTNEKIYSFIEKSNSRLNDKLIFEEHSFIDDISGVAVYSVPDLILLKANKKYLQLINSTSNKGINIIGKPINEIIKCFVGSQAELVWNSIIELKKTSYIKEIENAPSSLIPTYWSFSQRAIFEKGKIKYIFETASEATKIVFKNQCLERKNIIIERQKKQLEDHNIQLDSIIENLSEGLMFLDNKGEFIMVNSEAKRLVCNASKGISLAVSLKDTKVFDTIGNEILFENLPSVRALRGERIKNAKILLCHSNEEFFVEISSTPIYNSSGDLTMVVSCFHDITESIKQSRKIEEQKKELKSQGEFLVNVSHELKTPLNVIFATAQLFNLYCNNGSLDEKKSLIAKYIESIKQNTYRLSKLINNIVDISKIQAGFFELNLSNNNIVDVVEEIVMSVTNFSESKGLNIIFDTDVEEKIIACDPEKIERIILNLISNSIKFTDEGGEILVAIKDKDEFVELSVKDNGIGIDAKHLDIIFDRFKQIGDSLSRNAEGTGIGLNLVKSIVDLHNGSIYVNSQLGKGTKFTVKLPSINVTHQSTLYNRKVRSGNDIIQIELSDIYS